MSETVNVGTGDGSTVLEVIRAFETVSGRNIPYKLCNADLARLQHRLANQKPKRLLSMNSPTAVDDKMRNPAVLVIWFRNLTKGTC